MLRMIGRRALARRPPRPFAADARSGGWTNWAGNVSVARLARAVERPSSEPMLSQLVGSARRARVVGAGHSWSTVAGVDGSDCWVRRGESKSLAKEGLGGSRCPRQVTS